MFILRARKCCLLSLWAFLSQKLLLILLGPVGLDWNQLKKTLNPEFDWETAVQATLKTDDSLEEVCYKFTYYLVTQ